MLDLLQAKRRKFASPNFLIKKNGEKYSWDNCNDPSKGMFCGTCQKWENCPAGAKGGWTTRGITDWNHATELLKQQADSQ